MNQALPFFPEIEGSLKLSLHPLKLESLMFKFILKSEFIRKRILSFISNRSSEIYYSYFY